MWEWDGREEARATRRGCLHSPDLKMNRPLFNYFAYYYLEPTLLGMLDPEAVVVIAQLHVGILNVLQEEEQRKHRHLSH
jgi:hypothetical protein